jgi:ABC-2 type transport system permease protein
MKAIVIGLKDLRLRLRDRSAIIIAFIAPLVLATIISFAFQNEDLPFRATFGLVDLDQSEVSKSLATGIREIPVLRDSITLEPVASETEAATKMGKFEVSAVLVIPPGFGEAVRTGMATEIRVLGSPDFPIAGEVAQALASGFTSEINAGRLSIQTAITAGALATPGAPDLNALVQKAIQERIPISVRDGQLGVRQVTAADYFGPAMSIFFLFFTVQFGAISLITERREGTLNRLLAAPIKPASVVIGKVLSSFVLGLLSIGAMIAATSVLLDAKWGDPLAVAALTIAIVFAAMGITGLLITFAKTQEQASGFGAMAATGLALLGGNFIQVTDAPLIIRRLSLLTPNGWALRGFYDLAAAAEGGGITTILPVLGAVIAFGVVTGAAALFFGRRLVAT